MSTRKNVARGTNIFATCPIGLENFDPFPSETLALKTIYFSNSKKIMLVMCVPNFRSNRGI